MPTARQLNQLPLPARLKTTPFAAFCKKALAGVTASANSNGPEWVKVRVSAFLKNRVPSYWLRPDHVYHVRRHGLKWELNPHDFVDRDLFLHGHKEPEDFELVRRLVKPGDVILDVGANFGFYTVCLAKELGPLSKVHAFEPNRQTFGRLNRHVQINRLPNVHTYPIGLSDRRGALAIRSEAHNTGGAYLVQPNGPVGAQQLAAVTTLDLFVKERRLDRIDFVKVDIEGHEYRFLKGARETLMRFLPAMMMELSPCHLSRAGHSIQDVMDELAAIGYREFYLREGDVIRPFTSSTFKSNWTYWNVFCFRKRPATFPVGAVPSSGAGRESERLSLVEA